MDFSEDVKLSLPKFDTSFSKITESDVSKGLIIELAAIHEGTTSNFNYYGAEYLEESLTSWSAPYPKPIILHHDVYTEPMGRALSARMAQEADGTPFIMLQVGITDPVAIEKIKDKRYMTGSVGGKSAEAVCSICGVDWATAPMASGMPCKHSRGGNYKGKIGTLEMRGISWREYSFVNVPADENSSIRYIGEELDSAKIFGFDLDKRSLVEFVGDGQVQNIDLGIQENEIKPFYLNLKGSFITALAYSQSQENEKEKNMDKEITESEDELLSAVTSLNEEAVEEKTEEVTPEEKADETSEDKDVESAEEAPASEEGSEVEGEAKETEESGEEATEMESAEEAAVDTAEADAKEALDLRVTELEAEVAELTKSLSERDEEIVKLSAVKDQLKEALKKSLAERVVDLKIGAGLIGEDERKAVVEEHINRSASSLVDSLKDLAGFKKVVSTEMTSLKVEPKTLALSEESAVTEDTIEESATSNTPNPEDILVAAFMGRRSL